MADDLELQHIYRHELCHKSSCMMVIGCFVCWAGLHRSAVLCFGLYVVFTMCANMQRFPVGPLTSVIFNEAFWLVLVKDSGQPGISRPYATFSPGICSSDLLLFKSPDPHPFLWSRPHHLKSFPLFSPTHLLSLPSLWMRIMHSQLIQSKWRAWERLINIHMNLFRTTICIDLIAQTTEEHVNTAQL